MLEHPALRCQSCDGALALTLPAHGLAECVNEASGTCGNRAPDAVPAHKLPALCWQCVQCQRAVCACGDAACGDAGCRRLRLKDLARAGLGKNQCTGMRAGLGASEFTERVLNACLHHWLREAAGPTQVLAAFVCAYPDSVSLLAGAPAPQDQPSPRRRRTSALCNVVDMEGALHYAAKACGLTVRIDAIRTVVGMMQPSDCGTITHGDFRNFVRSETAFVASVFRWRVVGAVRIFVLALSSPAGGHTDSIPTLVCRQLTSTRTVAQWHEYYTELTNEPACHCAACRLWARLRTPGGAFAARETARWMRRVEFENGGIVMRTCLWLRAHFARPPLRKPLLAAAFD